ncbi:type II toxin-antitoxin system Phd/YefM family antitoxin [Candidatus Leptofilum sp.]|uniref:type II toxin-antitoxin system Phd/YefM family antitoxin n=1 Tax=Candidatus Leptofilum sp. TaxID=3241576 RepID=UPI003B5B37F9
MEASTGIRELKEQLSAYIRRVKSGETIVITDRGKPVGRLVPYSESLRDKLDVMAQAGFIRWDGHRLTPHEQIAKNNSEQLVSDLLLEDRD